MKHTGKTLLLMISTLVLSTDISCSVYAAMPGKIGNAPRPIPLNVKIDFSNRISGGEKTEGKIAVYPTPTEELVFDLLSTRPNLVNVDSEIRIKPGESSAPFKILSFSTLIKTSLTIKASLRQAEQVQAQKDLELVPALIKSVSLGSGSMLGTLGSKIQCNVELKAPAPQGGIELYLSPLKVSPALESRVSMESQNPRVPAGSKTVAFDIEYANLREDGRRLPDTFVCLDACFEAQRRTVELLTTIEPVGSKFELVHIPGLAHKVTFDFIPLRVTSISLQPVSVTGGAEGVVTFLLSAPPGNGEVAEVGPGRSAQSKLWVVPLGSACQANAQLGFKLFSGTTAYSFKVCTAPGTPTNSDKVYLKLHGRTFREEDTF